MLVETTYWVVGWVRQYLGLHLARYLLPAAEGFAGGHLASRLVSVEHQVGTEHAQIQLDQGSRI